MKNEIKILLAAPRGFCAGVDRAINIVKLSLDKYGPPIYVRHEIVHNPWVIKDLESKGVIFIENLRDCLLYTSPSPRDGLLSRMPSSA